MDVPRHLPPAIWRVSGVISRFVADDASRGAPGESAARHWRWPQIRIRSRGIGGWLGCHEMERSAIRHEASFGATFVTTPAFLCAPPGLPHGRQPRTCRFMARKCPRRAAAWREWQLR